MRKIEQLMIDVIYHQRETVLTAKTLCQQPKREVKIIDNTRIETGLREDGLIVTNVFLHDNFIAQYVAQSQWAFKMCGWNSSTTKSRINALAQAFGREGVYTKKGKHYSGGTEVNAYDWF